MDKLPKHIADMVGIIDDEPALPVVTEGRKPVMSVSFEPDGTIEISYAGKVCGWINEISYPTPDNAQYRAVAANGHSGHFWSIDGARNFLMSECF